MSTMKTKEVRSALLRKGFVQSNNDHEFFIFYLGTRKTAVRTKMSLGEKEFGDPLISMMSKELRLSKGQFAALVDCALTDKAYAAHLISSGHVTKAEARS